MRLSLIDLKMMSPRQHSLYDTMQAGIAASFAGVQTEAERSALAGPFNPWQYEPDFGRTSWAPNRTLTVTSTIPPHPREVATLVVGVHSRAAYEVESHRILSRETSHRVPSRQIGLPDREVDASVSGSRPLDLTAEEECASDLASARCSGGVGPASLDALAIRLFGEKNTRELVYLCGFYALTCMTLNAFDVPAPEPR